MGNQVFQLSAEQIGQIRAVPHFRDSAYKNLDIAATTDFFHRSYVVQLEKLVDIEKSVVVDCGCGYGWFTLSYLLAGGKAAIAVDLDMERLLAARQIIEISSLGERARFINSSIQDIPLTTDDADIFVSIETLEHVGKQNIRLSLEHIRDIASQAILITTPNRMFPVIAHDTRLPLIHWLPSDKRKLYAKLFGRLKREHGNDFLSPTDFGIFRDKFRVVSSCLTFQNFEGYRDHFPYYSPYGTDSRNRLQNHPSAAKAVYFRLASSVLGTRSYWAMPSLASIFVRK